MTEVSYRGRNCVTENSSGLPECDLLTVRLLTQRVWIGVFGSLQYLVKNEKGQPRSEWPPHHPVWTRGLLAKLRDELDLRRESRKQTFPCLCIDLNFISFCSCLPDHPASADAVQTELMNDIWWNWRVEKAWEVGRIFVCKHGDVSKASTGLEEPNIFHTSYNSPSQLSQTSAAVWPLTTDHPGEDSFSPCSWPGVLQGCGGCIWWWSQYPAL